MIREPFRFQRVDLEPSVNESVAPCLKTDTIAGFQDSSACIANLSNQKIRISDTRSQCNDYSALTISDCNDSEIDIDIVCGAIHMYNISRCTIYARVVSGSIQANQLNNSSVQGYCQQLRLTDCESAVVNVQTSSSTALVNCKDIKIGKPPRLEESCKYSELIKKVPQFSLSYITSDKWKNVNDFSHLSIGSNNWGFCE
jgi:hypothetical protein